VEVYLDLGLKTGRTSGRKPPFSPRPGPKTGFWPVFGPRAKNGFYPDLGPKTCFSGTECFFLAGSTRPSFLPVYSYAAQELSRFTSNPGEAHWREAKRSLRYLAGTTTLGLTYTQSDSTTLHPHRLYGFCDSDWGSDLDTRRSVGAFILFILSNFY